MKKISNLLKELGELFLIFFKIGLFTFGGGYAMIALIERETVERRAWLTPKDMMNMLIIAESTPGVIAINTATFVGHRRAGVLGGIVATLGAVLPSFLVITLICYFFDEFRNNYWINALFCGIRCAVPVLIFKAVTKLSRNMPLNVYNITVAAAAFAVSALTSFSSIYLILSGAVLGIILINLNEGILTKDILKRGERK